MANGPRNAPSVYPRVDRQTGPDYNSVTVHLSNGKSQAFKGPGGSRWPTVSSSGQNTSRPQFVIGLPGGRNVTFGNSPGLSHPGTIGNLVSAAARRAAARARRP